MPEQPAPLLLFDVGGTDVKAALTVGPEHALGPVLRVPVRAHGDVGGSDLVEQLEGIASQLLGAAVPAAAAVLSPGIVDERARRTVFAANLGLHDADLPDQLSARLGVPVGFGHDVGAAAQAEMLEGVGPAGSACTLVIVIGTGIASTAFVRGVRLSVPGAGELGHVPVPGGLVCSCGAIGCLETIASAAAIARAYTRESGVVVGGSAEVLARAQAGDAVAKSVWGRAVDALTYALHWCIGLLGVDRVVIGGGLSGAGEALLAPLRTALAARLSFMSVPDLVIASLGGDAGLRGARLLALEALASAMPAKNEGESQ